MFYLLHVICSVKHTLHVLGDVKANVPCEGSFLNLPILKDKSLLYQSHLLCDPINNSLRPSVFLCFYLCLSLSLHVCVRAHVRVCAWKPGDNFSYCSSGAVLTRSHHISQADQPVSLEDLSLPPQQ